MHTLWGNSCISVGGFMYRTYLLIVSLLFLAAQCTPAEPVELRVNLKKGDKYVQTMTTEQKVVQSLPQMGPGVPAGKQTQTSTVTITYTIECTDVDEEGTTIKLTYDRIQVEKEQSTAMDGSKSESPGRKTVYDSQKDENPTDPETIAYSVMIGNGFSVKLSPRAEVLDMLGVEEFLNRVYSGLKIPDTAEGREVKKMLHEQFGANTMKHMLSRSYLPYPEGKVAEGDSWKDTMDLGGAGFPLKVENTYTVDDLDSSEAVLMTEGKITSIEGQTMKIMSMELAYDIQGKQTGEQVIGLDKGVVVRSELKRTLKGETKVISMPQLSEEMVIPMEVETTITLETE